MTAIKGIVALFIAAAAIPAAADIVYKYERPDGRLIYSDSPVKGAKLIGQFDLVPSPPAEPAPPAVAPEQTVDQRGLALDEADARIKAADRALTEALQRQQKGMEPLPGERLGNVGGHSRLAPSYFARQQDYAADVDAARADLDEAYRLKNAVRD
jgi:hypothetical protein